MTKKRIPKIIHIAEAALRTYQGFQPELAATQIKYVQSGQAARDINNALALSRSGFFDLVEVESEADTPNGITIKQENTELTMPPLQLQPIVARQGGLDPIVESAWNGAITCYENQHMRRKNDALPRRMRILLCSLAGAPFSELEGKNPTLAISRVLQQARAQDVPTLKRLFPNLPPLVLK